MLSFSSYLRAKKPEKHDFFLPVATSWVSGAACSGFSVAFTAVLTVVLVAVFVSLVLLDLLDDFDFLVAIYSSFNNIYIIITRFLYDIIKKLIIYLGKNMGVIVNKENNLDNELSRRIDADLRARAMETVDIDGGEGDSVETDFTDDSEYMRDLKKTSKFGWMWVVLIVLAILSLISIMFF